MSMNIRLREMLVYHDGPALFVGLDSVDTLYLCVIAEKTARTDTYLCAPVSKKRLARLRKGLLPVRSVFDEPEQDRFVVLQVTDEDISEAQTRIVGIAEIESEWLPSPNYVYRDEPAPRETVLRQARERQKAVVHIALDAPESMGRRVIPAARLGQALSHIASFVKHAYNESIRVAEKSVKDTLQAPENFELNVFGVSTGSFVVHLESRSDSDMLGHVHIARALHLFDEINATLADKDKAVEVLRQHPGRVAQSYKRLLQYVVETNTPFSVQWATPAHEEPVVTSIGMSTAEAVYEKLLETHELGEERKTVSGVLIAVDIPHGTWRIRSDADSKEYWGDLDPESDASLEGLRLAPFANKIIYIERMEQDELGKEKLKRLLVSIRPLSH